MSTDKISAETIRYGNTFMYVDMAFYAILGFLIVVRSAVQGVFLAGYVLCAGVAELVSRILICAFLPQIVNGGAIDSSASTAAFAAVCFGDPGAWALASLVLLLPPVQIYNRQKVFVVECVSKQGDAVPALPFLLPEKCIVI